MRDPALARSAQGSGIVKAPSPPLIAGALQRSGLSPCLRTRLQPFNLRPIKAVSTISGCFQAVSMLHSARVTANNAPTVRKEFAYGAVMLAAGASTRMGKPKLLLRWGKTSVIGHLIRQWQQVGAKQIAVVRAAADNVIGAELDRLNFPVANRIMNAQPERGMMSSIQCAAAWPGWNAPLTHWIIVLGDQPHLRQETLRELVEFAS